MKETINSETEINSSSLASILGLSVRRIQQLTQDGKLIPYKRGVFKLGDAIRRYVAIQTEEQRISDEQVEKANRKKAVADARFKTAKAEIAELESSELKGKMHRSEDIEVLTNDMIFTIRSALNSLPGRLAVDCFHAVNEADCADIIRREIHAVMSELAKYEYDPERYAQLVRERQEWDDDDNEETDSQKGKSN